MSWTRVLLPLPLLLAAAAAVAQPLDRDAVLALARERAVELRAAAMREDRAAAQLGAARSWRLAPDLELEAGRRRGPEGESWDRSLGLHLPLDLFGRGDRIAAADATLAAVRAGGRAARVHVAATAARLHLRALYAADRRRLAADDLTLHERLLDIAERRHAAGETGRLDVHQTTAATARARMTLATATAAEQVILADLSDLLALAPGRDLAVRGELAWPAPADAAAVRTAAARHPALDDLAARARAAAAREREAGAGAWPTLGLGAGVAREEEADIVRFGVSVGLPAFGVVAGERGAAAAEARLAAVELEAARRGRDDRALRAWDRHHGLARALAAAEAAATPALDASVDLATRSYRLGEIPLDRMLMIQHDAYDARRQLADLRLETALAALELAETAALPPLTAAEEDTP